VHTSHSIDVSSHVMLVVKLQSMNSLYADLSSQQYWFFKVCMESQVMSACSSPGLCLHQTDTSWKLRNYVSQLRAEHVMWREIFWDVWGIVRVLYCLACHQHFPAHEFNQCQQEQGGKQSCSTEHRVCLWSNTLCLWSKTLCIDVILHYPSTSLSLHSISSFLEHVHRLSYFRLFCI
jgi:hypothetical protein